MPNFPIGIEPDKTQLKPQDQTPARNMIRETPNARRSPRFGLRVDITIHSPTCGVLAGRTVDISESGLSAMLTMDVPVGEIVELNLGLPSGSVKIGATVRQRLTFRYGFEFLGVNDGIRETCHQLAIAQCTPTGR
ncbi:MAG TPA: PilZ domain-containing protein [Terriglobales bacterium]|jgi:hypothetical protein|nr:PilZ domain-containing protein [Terriglobales bacterium]